MLEEQIIPRKKYLIAPKAKLDSIVESINTKYGFAQAKATATYGEPIKHPTENKWMLIVDGQFYGDFTESDLEEYGVFELTEDWNNKL